MSRTQQLAAVVLSACALATSVHAQDEVDMVGEGSWLQLSSKSLLHGTKGNARVVVRDGNHQASLEAPYEVVGAGSGGGTIKLRTRCGPMSFIFRVAEQGKVGFNLDTPDVQRLGRNAGVSRCGLGGRINLGWHLVANDVAN